MVDSKLLFNKRTYEYSIVSVEQIEKTSRKGLEHMNMGTISIVTSIINEMICRSHDGLSTALKKVLLGIYFSEIMLTLHFASVGVIAPTEVGYWSRNARGKMSSCQIGVFIEVGGINTQA